MEASLLIIEQHRHHAEAIYRDIHSFFDNYHIATTVKEADFYIREHNFDMLIVNPFFADGNGRNFISELKENNKLSTTPIIVISDLPASHVKLDFYSYGADVYIEMPYDKEWFKNIIREELLRHFQLFANNGRDKNTAFSSRAEFEQYFMNDQIKIRDTGEKGIIGLIAPAGIDFVIRDYGLETGNKLMASISMLMKKMCTAELQATFWTQKSIVFAMMDNPEEIIKESLDSLRQEFLRKFMEITKLQQTPGLRAVLAPIPIDKNLHEILEKLSKQLVQISESPHVDPIQFYGECMSMKRHVLIADPDPVAVSVIKHRLKKDGYDPDVFQRVSDILSYPAKDDIAAILIDSMVPGGGINMVRKINQEAELSDKPIMLLSRYGFEDEIANAFQAGAQDYLMKPLSMIELSARIKRLTG
ncbi:MAG: response regulator transcription factor [Candidatus Marinimicrobia bacterium]|nr:response regulator transcription factor [Candidatus Neomarinimicrobiota bacterium]